MRFSALQRAENFSTRRGIDKIIQTARFSALQRAENFSTVRGWLLLYDDLGFQCSSASRKFLNHSSVTDIIELLAVSVLFSEPKISQPSGWSGN